MARAETDRSLAAALSGSGGAAEASALRAVKARVDAGPASAAGGAPPPPGRAAGAPGPPPAPGGGVGGTDGFDGDTSTLGGARAGGDAAAAALALAAAGGRPASVAWEEADVLAVLADGTKRGAWPSSEAAAAVAAASKRHPFEYKEAHNPEAFFVPYLWCLAYGYAAESVGWTAGDFAGAAAAADGRAPTPDAAAAAGGAGGGGAPRQPAAPGPLFVSPAPRSGGRA